MIEETVLPLWRVEHMIEETVLPLGRVHRMIEETVSTLTEFEPHEHGDRFTLRQCRLPDCRDHLTHGRVRDT